MIISSAATLTDTVRETERGHRFISISILLINGRTDKVFVVPYQKGNELPSDCCALDDG